VKKRLHSATAPAAPPFRKSCANRSGLAISHDKASVLRGC
jgi:hypothetical protein